MDCRFLPLLACPACAGELLASGGELRCAGCGARHAVRGGIPALCPPLDERSERVRAFYRDAPFPGYPPGDNLSGLRARAGRSELARLLDAAIPGDARVLDLGCGTGQMGLFLANADRLVVGADLSRPSLELAQAAAGRYRIDNALFVETDLRAAGLRRGAFDVVFCSGVLHHTPDPRASFAAIAPLVRPGGVVLVGLYNAFARLPTRLIRGLARLVGPAALRLDPVLRERALQPDRRRAWLRDQYQHPEEHRHTVAEVRGWFADAGIRFLRTLPSSLLGQEPTEPRALFTSDEDSFAPEAWLAQLSWVTSLGHEGGLFVAVGGRAG